MTTSSPEFGRKTPVNGDFIDFSTPFNLNHGGFQSASPAETHDLDPDDVINRATGPDTQGDIAESTTASPQAADGMSILNITPEHIRAFGQAIRGLNVGQVPDDELREQNEWLLHHYFAARDAVQELVPFAQASLRPGSVQTNPGMLIEGQVVGSPASDGLSPRDQRAAARAARKGQQWDPPQHINTDQGWYRAPRAAGKEPVDKRPSDTPPAPRQEQSVDRERRSSRGSKVAMAIGLAAVLWIVAPVAGKVAGVKAASGESLKSSVGIVVADETVGGAGNLVELLKP